MKKAITILAVLIVLVGAVFADTLPQQNHSESHAITLRTTVTSTLPIFRLTATSNNNTVTTNPDGNEDAAKFANGEAYVGTGELAVVDISTTNIVATFTASLENTAKTAGTYRLSFEAGDFENVWRMTDGQLVKDHVVAPSTQTRPTLAKAASEIAGTGIDIANPVGSYIDVTFNGQECTTGKIAVYTVQYDRDPAIVDNNGAGYTADVTMTVTFQ